MSRYFNTLPLPVDTKCLVPYGLPADDVFSVAELREVISHVLFLTLQRLETISGRIFSELCQLDYSSRCDLRENIRQDDILMLELKPAFETAAASIDYLEEQLREDKGFPDVISRMCDKFPGLIDVFHNNRGDDFIKHVVHIPRRSCRVKRQTQFYYY